MNAGCKCPVTGGEHKIESFLAESVPPGEAALAQISLNTMWCEAQHRLDVIAALSHCRYVVCCSACGLAVAEDEHANKPEDAHA